MLCCGMGVNRNRVSREVQGYQRGVRMSGPTPFCTPMARPCPEGWSECTYVLYDQLHVGCYGGGGGGSNGGGHHGGPQDYGAGGGGAGYRRPGSRTLTPSAPRPVPHQKQMGLRTAQPSGRNRARVTARTNVRQRGAATPQQDGDGGKALTGCWGPHPHYNKWGPQYCP